MAGSVTRWRVLVVFAFVLAVATGCAQQYYQPTGGGPDHLALGVQYRWNYAGTYNVFASALVTRPDGSYQKVDNLKIWVKTADLKDYAENYGESQVSVHTYRPTAPSDNPKAYACATYKGQTWCSGDQSAK